jgi:hypothetical protein
VDGHQQLGQPDIDGERLPLLRINFGNGVGERDRVA